MLSTRYFIQQFLNQFPVRPIFICIAETSRYRFLYIPDVVIFPGAGHFIFSQIIAGALQYRVPIHIVSGTDLVPVPVYMEYHTPFPVITEHLAVPLLVYNLADLTLAVIPVGNDAAVGIRGTGNMAGIIIGKVLLSSLCRLNLMYSINLSSR